MAWIMSAHRKRDRRVYITPDHLPCLLPSVLHQAEMLRARPNQSDHPNGRGSASNAAAVATWWLSTGSSPSWLRITAPEKTQSSAQRSSSSLPRTTRARLSPSSCRLAPV
eukprot:6183605-Pleurochrysis_carterae.AAC.1